MLQHARQDGVVTLTLQRPERGNALSADLVEALIGQVQQTFGEAVHTLVLRGAGAHFCTGLDLSDLDQASDGDLLQRLVRIEALLALLWHAPLRTVALVQGRTWGAGADLLAVCEERIAQPGSTFRFPGAQFGIVLGTRRLAERIGSDAARRLVGEGAELSAEQALAHKLISAIGIEPAPGHDLASLQPPRVDAATARALREATRTDGRDADLAALVRSASTPGLKHRIQAYRQRLRGG